LPPCTISEFIHFMSKNYVGMLFVHAITVPIQERTSTCGLDRALLLLPPFVQKVQTQKKINTTLSKCRKRIKCKKEEENKCKTLLAQYY